VTTVSRHGFIGLSELFLQPLRRFGAVCTSERMLYMQYSFKNHKVGEEWRKVFKSTYFTVVRDQIKDSLERDLQARLRQYKLQ
jgi:hypothetical protein